MVLSLPYRRDSGVGKKREKKKRYDNFEYIIVIISTRSINCLRTLLVIYALVARLPGGFLIKLKLNWISNIYLN